MPKCSYISCDQTAHYGRQFNRPIYCRLHMPADCGSVKKKCAQQQCINATFTGEMCPRCNEIHVEIRRFSELKIRDLEAKCMSEAAAPVPEQTLLRATPDTTMRNTTSVAAPQSSLSTMSATPTAPVAQPKAKKTDLTKMGQPQPAALKPRDHFGSVAPEPASRPMQGATKTGVVKRTQTPAARPKPGKSQPSGVGNAAMI